jgi:hypothetical protein
MLLTCSTPIHTSPLCLCITTPTCVAACTAPATSRVPSVRSPALPAALAAHGTTHRGQGGAPAASSTGATAAAPATKGNHGAGADEPAVATCCTRAAAAPAHTHRVGGAGSDRHVVGPYQTTPCSNKHIALVTVSDGSICQH